jgi:predicted nucleotidyltransferase
MPPTSFARQPYDVILSSGGAIRILRALLSHGGSLSVSRLAMDATMTPDGVRGVLVNLEWCGVVEMVGSGRSRLYRAVGGHPLVGGLENLFAAERRRYEGMLAAIAEAAVDPQIAAVWLFGSVARHEDGPDSDLDVAVVVEGGADDIDRISNRVRETLSAESDRTGFRVSVVSMSMDDVRRHHDEGSVLWSGLAPHAVPVKGPTPARLAGQLAGRPLAGEAA